jgi:hypothetical protein
MAGSQSLIVKGLQPNTIYKLQVYAVKTVNGTVTHSPSTTTTITTGANSTGGNNFKVTNGGTDMQLAGGTIYAGTFDDGLGQLDPLTGSSDGVTPSALTASNYGVALNQFGIMAYNGGTPEFYIDSRTGNAFFAGTLTIGSITDAGGATQSSVDSLSGSISSISSSLSNYILQSGYTPQTFTSIGHGTVNTGTLYSNNLTVPLTGTYVYSTTGSYIDLSTGAIITPSLAIWPPAVDSTTPTGPNHDTNNWSAYFAGTLMNSLDGQNGIVIQSYTNPPSNISGGTPIGGTDAAYSINFNKAGTTYASMGLFGTNNFSISLANSSGAVAGYLDLGVYATAIGGYNSIQLNGSDNRIWLQSSTPYNQSGLRNIIAVSSTASAPSGNNGDIYVTY